MACGCQSACGCNVVAGDNISVMRIGDDFHVSADAAPLPTRVVAEYDSSDTIAEGVDLAIFDPATDATAILPDALEGVSLEIWNHIADFGNLTLDPAGTDTFHAGDDAFLTDPVVIGGNARASLVCLVDGEWRIHVDN